MEPSHITEFASERYFDKLKKLEEPQGPSSVDASTIVSSSTFILPIGKPPRSSEHGLATAQGHEPKTSEKKRSNFSFRGILSSRTSDHDRHSAAAAEKAKSESRFSHLFLALPAELQIQIIASLPLSDVLNMRLASRSWHAVITMNEMPIARYHLSHHIPAYAMRLYPPPPIPSINFHYLCGIWHRLHVAAKLSFLICEQITKEIFLRTSEAQRQEFAPQHERMRRRLIPLLFTIFHFFETYRSLHLKYVEEHGHGLHKMPYTVNPIEAQIMNTYDDKTLLQVHQVFPLVVSTFVRRLRPPSYAGRLERSIRGYMKDKPADEIYATVLLVGGLRRVERFWEIKGYNTRRCAVDDWYNSVAKDPVEPAAPKAKRGLLGLSRKKSSFNVKGAANAHAEPPPPLPNQRSRNGHDGQRPKSDVSMSGMSIPGSSVFGTSMSVGMPMESLTREHLRPIIPDLPILQQIWLPTAEAIILDRGIVPRSQDIKRNAQVMLELIREDGAAAEDEWWYGHGTPESLRPPREAMEEDPIE